MQKNFHIDLSWCLLVGLRQSKETGNVLLSQSQTWNIDIIYSWPFEGYHDAHVPLPENEFDNPGLE